jgi:hypothetical protein
MSIAAQSHTADNLVGHYVKSTYGSHPVCVLSGEPELMSKLSVAVTKLDEKAQRNIGIDYAFLEFDSKDSMMSFMDGLSLAIYMHGAGLRLRYGLYDNGVHIKAGTL